MRATKVVLNPAYVWDCDECGKENFERGIVPDYSPEDLESLRADHGVESWEAGDFVVMPERVKCSHCGTEFATAHISDE